MVWPRKRSWSWVRSGGMKTRAAVKDVAPGLTIIVGLAALWFFEDLLPKGPAWAWPFIGAVAILIPLARAIGNIVESTDRQNALLEEILEELRRR